MGGGDDAAIDIARTAGSTSAVDKHDHFGEESESLLSVDDLLATFKREDKLRAKRRAKRLRHNTAKQNRRAAARGGLQKPNVSIDCS